MDLLCKVYGGTSDEEEDNGRIHLQRPILPQPKRAKFENFHQISNHLPLYKSNPSANLPEQASLPGRYVSKRERAAMAFVEKVPDLSATVSPNSSPVLGSILDSVLPHNILSALRDQTKVYGNMIHMPERLSVVLDGHKRSVNAVQWSTSHGPDDYLPPLMLK
ncbi:hypothetical protein RDI58_009964 [Solanum bulbocastanum]|uniref:Uncharacterized protein n=1 Tax=Solanum bulbocastanum TaxID=147425 RepID=A0AAN8TU74_SOLBU